MKGYGQGKMSGGKATGSCHDGSNMGYSDCSGKDSKPKPIGNGMKGAKPDMKTPSFGPGMANGHKK